MERKITDKKKRLADHESACERIKAFVQSGAKPLQWIGKLFECKNMGQEPPLNKEGFWEKKDFNEFNKEFIRQTKVKNG